MAKEKRMREQIAEHAHVVWQTWMGYMLANLDEAHFDRWKQQAHTAYKDLPEQEKDSDRAIANEYIALIRKEIEKMEIPQFYEDWGGECGRAGFKQCLQMVLEVLEV